MATDPNGVNLTLHITDNEIEPDTDEIKDLAQTLMRGLESMAVESVTLATAQSSSEGQKGDFVALGTLLVATLPSTFPKIMEFLQAWALRNKDHKVQVKVQRGDRSADIEYPANMTSEELKSHLEVIKRMIED